MSTLAPSLVMGTFETERFWRDPDVASLPSISFSIGVVDAMDELLVALCRPGDILVTRAPLDSTHRDYMTETLLSPTQTVSVEAQDDPTHAGESVASLALELCRRSEDARAQLSNAGHTRVFAVEKAVAELVAYLGLPELPTTAECVASVSSKQFSKAIHRELAPWSCHGAHCENFDDLVTSSRTLLERGDVLLKEDHGVSGKGTIRVSTSRQLDRMLRHLHPQVKSGKRISLTVEPLLDKALDFSCHFDIEDDGEWSMHFLQLVVNHDFGYLGSGPVMSVMRGYVEESGYFTTIERVAAALAARGYVGPVCVDSMILRDGTLIPIVEINARYSMGRMGGMLAATLALTNYRLLSLNVIHPGSLSFDRLLDALAQKNLLLSRSRPVGICPLSANTLHPSSVERSDVVHGRLYALLEGGDASQLDRVSTNLLEVLGELGARVKSPLTWPRECTVIAEMVT